MKMSACPKFDQCSAPICPLDPDWKIRSHLEGERVCFYLTEYSKPAGKALLRAGLPIEHYEVLVRGIPRGYCPAWPYPKTAETVKQEPSKDRS